MSVGMFTDYYLICLQQLLPNLFTDYYPICPSILLLTTASHLTTNSQLSDNYHVCLSTVQLLSCVLTDHGTATVLLSQSVYCPATTLSVY